MCIVYTDRLPGTGVPVLPSTPDPRLGLSFWTSNSTATPGGSSSGRVSGLPMQDGNVTPPTKTAPQRKRASKKKAQVVTDDTVHVLIAIDASGSMAPKAVDVIGGFNAYVKGLREDRATKYRLTVVTFDTDVRTLYADLPLADVPGLDGRAYRPCGNTALLDAIGVSLDEMTAAVKVPEHPYGTERVLAIIMTDGEENSSRRFHREDIKTRITARTDAGNWTFVYIGESLDVWADAGGLGFAAGNTVAFNSAVASGSTMHALAQSTTSYSRSGARSMSAFGQTIDPVALGVAPGSPVLGANLNGSNASGSFAISVGSTTPAALPTNDYPPRIHQQSAAPKKHTRKKKAGQD